MCKFVALPCKGGYFKTFNLDYIIKLERIDDSSFHLFLRDAALDPVHGVVYSVETILLPLDRFNADVIEAGLMLGASPYEDEDEDDDDQSEECDPDDVLGFDDE